MIRNRGREAFIGISLAIILSLFIFAGQGDTKTGMAYTSLQSENADDVIISGLEFEARINGIATYYMYTDDGSWYKSSDEIAWEKVSGMGDMWQGLYKLNSADAKIFFMDTEIKDLGEFAKEFR